MVGNQLTLFKKQPIKYDRKISEIIDIEEQLDKFNNGKIKLVNVQKKMYNLSSKSAIVQDLSELKVSCVSDVELDLPIIPRERQNNIKSRKMTQMHVGLIMIGVKGLHRKHLGTKTLVILFDDRWSDLAKSIIGSFEIDMNENGAIIYFIPNFIMDTTECLEHLKIGIKTKGYNMVKGSLNLRITIGFIGKMQEHSDVRFKLDNEELENMLASQGIKALPGIKFGSEIHAGSEWNLKTFVNKTILVPQENTSYENLDGTLSMRFLDYQSRVLHTESVDDNSELGNH